MPISCDNGQEPRYRVKKTGKAKIRLAFCGNEVVEHKKLKAKATGKNGK